VAPCPAVGQVAQRGSPRMALQCAVEALGEVHDGNPGQVEECGEA
jgi:hypothetical protein